MPWNEQWSCDSSYLHMAPERDIRGLPIGHHCSTFLHIRSVRSVIVSWWVFFSMYIYRQTPQCKAAHASSMHLHLVCDGWKSGSFDVIACLCNSSYRSFVCTPVDWLSIVPSIPWCLYIYICIGSGRVGGKGEAYLRSGVNTTFTSEDCMLFRKRNMSMVPCLLCSLTLRSIGSV